MPKLEKHFESLLQNFPNLLTPDLCGQQFAAVKDFGAVNACIRQGPLPECDGRIDVAFVTEEIVYLAELKRSTVDKTALDQLRRYLRAIRRRYPRHTIRSFLVGHFCPNEEDLLALIGSDPIKILLFHRDIPWYTEVTSCRQCGAGAGTDEEFCPCCKNPLV
jgi:hypothetical protein